MLKETLRKLMNLSLEEKPEGKITEVKIGMDYEQKCKRNVSG